MTKTNNLGFVASYPIPEVLRNINAFTLGARSVNPKVTTRVVWISTWYNPGLERQAAEALVGQGADVLYQNTDSPALVQLAEAKGLYAFGQDSDMAKYGPKAELTANTVNWAVYYRYKIQQVLNGTWKSEDTKWGMKEGMIEMMPLNASLPPAVAKLFNDKKADIASGRFKPFSGPVKNQQGAVWIAAGQTLPENDLWTMNLYVEGVVGDLPK
jgi:basic membrane protein A